MEEGEDANDGVILDILLYMTHHPDLFHHPNEELMFSRLMMYMTHEPEAIRQLRGEHRSIADFAERLMDDVRARINDLSEPQDDVAAECRQYIDQMHEHMALEESEAFPLCQEHLEAADWEWIETRAKIRETPFARDLARRHVSFYRRILEEA